MLLKQTVIALRATLVTLVLTGFLYPLVVTGLAQVLFPSRANGSLITDEHGNVIGSELIGQSFTNSAYLWSRPSAAGDKGYDPTASGGSNLGPTSAKLRDRVAQEIKRLQQTNPEARGPVPADLVTTSASGLDPDVTPEAARWQAPRIARARQVSVDRVLAVISSEEEGRELGFLGEPRVNVLRVNLALDRQFGRPGVAAAAR
jgi:K+-transporting ATPase ATPase C chain